MGFNVPSETVGVSVSPYSRITKRAVRIRERGGGEKEGERRGESI